MLKHLVLSVALTPFLALAAMPAAAQDDVSVGSAPISAIDDAALRTLATTGADAYNRGDHAGIAAMFEEHADLVAGDGLHARGRAGISNYFAGLMQRLPPGTRYVVRVDHVRMVGPDLAIIHSLGGWVPPGETEAPANRRGVQVIVARREAGRWECVLLQVTRTVPPTPSA